MQPNQFNHSGNARLRFVFDNAVVSFGLAADLTPHEIARTLDQLSDRHYGKPLAIDVTLDSPDGNSVQTRSR